MGPGAANKPQIGMRFKDFISRNSGSSYIVTHNRDDFREAGRFGINVVTPGELLRTL